MEGVQIRVQGLGIRDEERRGLGLRVEGLGFKGQSLGFKG